ncbi:hypothetical protein AAE478_003251 [Parahypoxylon ruwenzoriense]
MPMNFYVPARPVLQDASYRVNQTPIPLPPGIKPAAGQPLIVAATQPAPKTTGSRKRKSETSLEDDIAVYKQNLDHIDTDGMQIDMTCNQVRGRINRLLDSGIMKKGEFCKAIGSNGNSLNTFLSKRGSMEGANSCVYDNAWGWFKQRELAGLKLPDVKKRQKTEALAVATDATDASIPPPVVATGSSKARKAAAPPAPGPDVNAIHLPGEETNSVPIYDTCDEIRRKINAHLKTPALTAAQFCRDIYAQLNQPSIKCFQSKQLNDFRGKKGPTAGATSQVFYAAYVYFEKKRIAEGKPKSKHRLEMEKAWPGSGFDREHDGRHGFWVGPNESPTMDQYGQIHFYRR